MQFNQDFITKMQKLLGKESNKFFAELENPSVKAITVRHSKMDKASFKNIADFNTTPVPEVENGYIVENLKFGPHILNHLGVIYSQEPSAMYPVEMLDIEPNDTVLDLCSAPGGKSIQILEKLNGTGLLVANEIVFSRAKVLYENLNRMGFKNFIITCNSPQDFEKTSLKFDKILVDAPCGGEGMFRKNNFDFAAYNNASIETNAKRQLSILDSIKNLLKPNGKLVYSTCTYDIRENECVVAEFLKNNNDYNLLSYPRLDKVSSSGIKLENSTTDLTKRRYPHHFPGEGQFMALMQKDNYELDYNSCRFFAKGYEDIYKKDVEILRKTFNNVANIKDLEIIKRNDNFYILPNNELNFEDLNVVSVGVLMGSIVKGTFKIAHEFYHTYGDLFFNKYELNSSQVIDYLKGYELDIDSNIAGICVVTHLNIPLGGGKISNGKLKNYYPKNLRTN